MFSFDSDTVGRKNLSGNEQINSDLIDSIGHRPDIWKMVLQSATEQRENLKIAISLFHLFACSGEDIPTKHVYTLCNIANSLDIEFDDDYELLKAIFMIVWMRSIGKQELQSIIASLLSKHISRTADALKISEGRTER